MKYVEVVEGNNWLQVVLVLVYAWLADQPHWCYKKMFKIKHFRTTLIESILNITCWSKMAS